MNPPTAQANQKHVPHLTESELDDVLLGDPTSAATAHLAACERCRTSLAAIEQPLAQFRAATLAWAEQRSAAMPSPLAASSAAHPLRAGTAASMHLTDEQLEDMLIGDATPAVAAHLSGCAPCTQRLAELEQPIAGFRAVSLAWSERRSATLPLRDPSESTPSLARRYGWAAAMAAALAITVTVATHHREGGPDTAVATVAAPQAEARRQQQIAADNQMLAAIDHELDVSQATLAQFGVERPALREHARGRNSLNRTEQD
jgi:hypothetical protein